MSKLRLTLYDLVVVVALAGLAARSPLAAINALSPGGASETTSDLAYGPGARNKLDIDRAGLAAKLRACGVPVRDVYYDGVGHTTLVASLAAPLRSLAPTLDAIEQFIRSKSALIQVQPM